MTVNELIERLQEVADDGLGEATVRLAFQPSWGLQFNVGGISIPDDDGNEDEENPGEDADEGADPVVFIFEGSSPHDSPYAPGWAFNGSR